MSKSRIRGLSLASFLVSLLLATTAYAQSGSSTVQGTVKDPLGNLVSGATVTLTDPAKNFSRTQQTNADGAYVFTAIPPRTYKLEVTAPGFKTASASGLVALVDTPSGQRTIATTTDASWIERMQVEEFVGRSVQVDGDRLVA